MDDSNGGKSGMTMDTGRQAAMSFAVGAGRSW